MTIIERFAKVFRTTEKDLKFWKKEHMLTDKIIIAGPSRIVGLIDLNKIDDDIEWTTYEKNSDPTKKMVGNFVFEGGMYGIRWLRNIYPMLSETIDVAKYNIVILFKITEDMAVGIGEKRTHEDFYYNDEGVMFVDWDFEKTKKEWKTVAKAKEFIKWENGVAKRKHKGKANIWYEEVYKFERFFEEEEEMGDMMLI